MLKYGTLRVGDGAFFCYEIERLTKKIKGDETEKILLFLLFPEN